MKNILLLVHDDAGQEARLRAALDVTRAIDGHLICLDVAVMRVLPGDGLGWDGGAMLLEEEYRLEGANRVRLEQRLGGESVDWEWIDATGFLEQSLEDAADRADLIVVNCGLERCAGLAMRTLAADLAVKSGKPLLTVPANATGLDVTGPALVAWDGSAPARAALTAAIPLLRLAGSVTILEVRDGSVKPSAEEAGAILAHKGIDAGIVRETEGPASDRLLAECRSGTYDLLVMGGFGHSRFREALFGGVTRRMLEESPIPLFLAH